MITPVEYPPINFAMEPWISATQISTFELCNRKWAFKWLERVYAPPNKFAQLGIDTHGKLERWLRAGIVPVPELSHENDEHRKRDEHAVKLAHALIPYLPPPQMVDPKNVERDELIVVEDVLFNIKVDLHMPELVSWDGVVRPRTFDHKTSGDPKKWAPKPEHIQFDPQAALYAAWTIILTGKTEVDLQWDYVKTKGAINVHPVYATVTDAMITPRMQKNVATGREIKAHYAQTKRALDVVADASACDEYGGCPYKDRCGITARERIVSVMNDFKNQPATQQFLQSVPTNGQPVNPTPFAPPPQPPGGFAAVPPQFAPPGAMPQQAPQAPPQFAAPMAPAPQFAAPPPPPQFSAPAAAPQAPPQFAPPPQAPQQFAPPPAPQYAPQPPPQAPPQFAPPQGNVMQQAAPPPAENKAGRAKHPKEYDVAGAWATIFAGTIVVCQGNISVAAQMADQALQELKARQ